jgi:hypothetical protein
VHRHRRSIGRVASTAGHSEVRVSQTVKDLVAGSGFTFDDIGEQQLKGFPIAGASTLWCQRRSEEPDGRRTVNS